MPKFRVAVTAYAEFEVTARNKKWAVIIAQAQALQYMEKQNRLSIRVEPATENT